MVLLEIMLKGKVYVNLQRMKFQRTIHEIRGTDELSNCWYFSFRIPEGNVEPQSLDNIGKSKIHF